jgi:LacI family transcriptional regulator
MTVTIKDVARLAGCSVKTVSRVVNNEPYVRGDQRARVQATIRTMGYTPNISARRLVTQKSYMVCILMYPGFHQSASAILNRILDMTYEEEYDILIQPYFPGHKRSGNKLLNLVAERRIDGFVITPPCDADNLIIDLLTTYKVPLVLINPLNRTDKIPSVSGDDYNGAYAMTEYLIGLGHRRISFLMGPRNMRTSMDRLYGYRAALDSHQIAQDPRWVENSEYTFDGGYWAAKLLLDRDPDLTAIFAGNDEAALGALFALQELGRRIPGEISVCGFDDMALSKTVWPGLTTVRQPADEMIQLATQMLIRILKGQPPERPEILLSSQLVIRGSTGSPGNGK